MKAKDILEYLKDYNNRIEIFKGILADSMGLENISEDDDKILDELFEYYMENDNIRSFINDDLYEEAVAKMMMRVRAYGRINFNRHHNINFMVFI